MSDASHQKIPANKSYSAFYTDDNEFCFQAGVSRICVNPTKIFTSTFKSMNTEVEQSGKSRYIALGRHYHVLKAYFSNDASEKYIAMLDETEWKFWFIHVTIQLRKLQTSPQWKQDGNLDTNDTMMFATCPLIFHHAFRLKLFAKESPLQVPRDFFHALASCIDTLTPRLPHREFVRMFTDTCTLLLEEDYEITMLKMMEKSGLLVQILRCSTMPLDDMETTYKFYIDLTHQLSFIKKKFKTGQPCNNIIQKILAGDDGHSNPDPKVLNFLQTILKLADKTHQDLPFHLNKYCEFCRTKLSEHLLLCSQCRKAHYCSKECQRNDWKNHKQCCEQNSSLEIKNIDKYENMAKNFLIDHADELQAKLDETISETGLKQNELVLNLDFVADESGVAPALSNPPRFEMLSVKNTLEKLKKLYPNAPKVKTRDLKETEMYLMWRSPVRVNMIVLGPK